MRLILDTSEGVAFEKWYRFKWLKVVAEIISLSKIDVILLHNILPRYSMYV